MLVYQREPQQTWGFPLNRKKKNGVTLVFFQLHPGIISGQIIATSPQNVAEEGKSPYFTEIKFV